MEAHLEISVWDIVNGDVVKKVWDGSWDDFDELCAAYDDGIHEVVIDREWEETEDEK